MKTTTTTPRTRINAIKNAAQEIHQFCFIPHSFVCSQRSGAIIKISVIQIKSKWAMLFRMRMVRGGEGRRK